MKIVRKDGIVYEKRPRVINNDVKICIRINKDLLNQFREKSKKVGIPYSKLLRKYMEDFIKEN